MRSRNTKALSTRTVALRWFDALTHGRVDDAMACLASNVEWINYTPVPGYNDAMPWIGTRHGPDEVKASYQIFVSVCNPESEELLRLAVDGKDAFGVVHERGTVRATEKAYEIEFVQWLTVREGKIVRWKSYTDPSSILRAIAGKA